MRDETPLVKGGQGRSGEDVKQSAYWLAIVVVLAVWFLAMRAILS